MPEPIHQVLATVLANDEIISDHKVITCVAPEIAAQARPGHFVNCITSDGYDPLLRKPFSIYTVNRERGEISLLYSIVGAITRGMAKKRPGDILDIAGPLGGRLFKPDTRSNAVHIMVGGGYGVPPLVFLADELKRADPNVKIVFVIGAREKSLLLGELELSQISVETRVSTEDGSHGMRGRVTDVLLPLLEENVDNAVSVYCCGSTPMMRAVSDLCLSRDVNCQLSVEVAMPCGVGVCMGCVIDLTDGRRVRCCTDGPVFEASEVAW